MSEKMYMAQEEMIIRLLASIGTKLSNVSYHSVCAERLTQMQDPERSIDKAVDYIQPKDELPFSEKNE